MESPSLAQTVYVVLETYYKHADCWQLIFIGGKELRRAILNKIAEDITENPPSIHHSLPENAPLDDLIELVLNFGNEAVENEWGPGWVSIVKVVCTNPQVIEIQ